MSGPRYTPPTVQKSGAAVRAARPATGKSAFSAAAALLVGLAVGGCSSSPPVRFYTLSDSPPAPAAPAAAVSIGIGGVTIPGEIDRPEFVRLTAPNRLDIADLERWAAPLDQMIQRVLSDDIARRTVAAAAGPQRSVSVDVREFYGDENCNVILHAVWTLKPLKPNGTPTTATEDIRLPASGACPDNLAQTMSTALGQLSDRIVAGVAQLPPAAR